MSLLAASGFPAEAYAVKRSLGRVWLRTVLSFGLYGYAWFYVHRRLLDGELGHARDDATLHTLGLLVPILNLFIIHWLWRDLNALRLRFGLREFPEIAYLVGSIFLAPLFFSLVVDQLNEYWEVRTQGLVTDAELTSFERASLVIGGILLVVWVLSMLAAIVVLVIAAPDCRASATSGGFIRGMESGSPPPDRPDSERQGGDPPAGPQAPAGPQSPAPGPSAPIGAPAPGPAVPPPPGAPGHYPAPGPEAAPGYGGPVPPGGWQQPIAQQQAGPGWVGKPLASWGSRVGATLLDALILLVPSAILIGLVVGVVLAGSDVGAVVIGIISFLLYVVIALIYAPVLMARDGEHNGQTWGKQIVGITVVRDNGQPIELGFGFLREIAVKNLLFGFVGGFFLSIPTIVDWLWPLWDDENRCLHDMIVSTHVVRT